MLKAVLYLASLLLLGVLLAFDIYSLFINKTNHTGFEVHTLVYLFAAVGFACLLLMLFLKMNGTLVQVRPVLIGLVLLSILGVLNIYAFERFNIMLEYLDWARKGMPGKPVLW